MKMLGWTQAIEVKPLSKQAAVDLGAELIGEFFVFSVALAILYGETKRSQKKDQAKESKQNQTLAHLQNQINNLAFQLEQQHEENKDLKSKFNDISQNLKEVLDK